MLANTDIRNRAKEKNVRLWEVADRLNISEPTITRKLRKELSAEEKHTIFKIIDEIASEKKTAAAE